MNHLVHLRTFLDAYRAGSLTKAAQRLGITQPAASAHIQSLEVLLGRPLFHRRARGVEPTPAADDLARSIAAHLDEIELTLGTLRVRSTQLTGTVHIAGPAEFLSVRIAAALAPLARDGLRLRFQTGNRDRIYAALDEGLVDLAVTASRPDAGRHDHAEFARERLTLVASRTLAASLRGLTIDAPTLRAVPCLAYDENLPLVREFFTEVFDAEADMQAAVIAPDLRMLLAFVRADAGWTVLPDYLCAADLAEGAVVRLATPRPGPTKPLHLVWNKGALRHPRVVHVRDQLLQTLSA